MSNAAEYGEQVCFVWITEEAATWRRREMEKSGGEIGGRRARATWATWAEGPAVGDTSLWKARARVTRDRGLGRALSAFPASVGEQVEDSEGAGGTEPDDQGRQVEEDENPTKEEEAEGGREEWEGERERERCEEDGEGQTSAEGRESRLAAKFRMVEYESGLARCQSTRRGV